MGRRSLIAVVLTLALVVGVGGVFYAFGTPEQQSSPVASSSPVPAVPAAGPAVAAESAAAAVPAAPKAGTDGEASPPVPEPDPASPLAIEIPGCRCHSDDPELVKEHESYRMNQCAGCHAGGVPTGQ